jgi:cyanophycinase
MNESAKGFLVIIGGAEDKSGDSLILKQAPQMMTSNEMLSIVTTATEQPEEVGKEYQNVFKRIGVPNTQILNINTRDDANDIRMCEAIKNSKCVFLTGGDQLRVTSILGGTNAYTELRNIYFNGGLIMGTSAGASVMSSTMVVQGNDNEPAKKCTLKMAPGLGFFKDTIIDQHFDQRGRFGRLLCGVAENPGILGIGIDEDTAIKLYPDLHFEVLGNNTITIIDGNTIKSSNVSELMQDEMLAIIGVSVHTLPAGYGFNMITREVMRLKHDS